MKASILPPELRATMEEAARNAMSSVAGHSSLSLFAALGAGGVNPCRRSVTRPQMTAAPFHQHRAYAKLQSQARSAPSPVPSRLHQPALSLVRVLNPQVAALPRH